MALGSTIKGGCCGLVLLLALGGCSETTDGGDGNNMMTAGSTTPTAGTTGGGAGTTMSGGAGSTSTPASGSGGSTASGGSGSGGTVGSAGSGAGGATGAGAGGTTAEAGAGGAGGSTGGLDTSGFLEDCKQGGAQWGTDQQKGPCKSGISTYGVKSAFGPYGVRSEHNVGQGYEANGTDFASAFFGGCALFIDGFGADPVGSADLKNTHDLNFDLYTVFYPGVMPEGEKFPLITWGNGTCAMPEGYGPLLRYVASFGYIVIAANDLATGGGASMLKALDFMLAENENQNSKFYQRIDPDKIGAMGHSQGGGATISAASDARIKAIIIWNGGTSGPKPFLAVSGDRDLGGTPAGMANAVNAAQRPAAWLWYHQIPAAVNGSTTGATAPGHLTLMMESERVNDVAVAWWDMMLKGKEEAKKMFVGDGCTLCDGTAFPSMWADPKTPPSIEYGHNTMLQ